MDKSSMQFAHNVLCEESAACWKTKISIRVITEFFWFSNLRYFSIELKQHAYSTYSKYNIVNRSQGKKEGAVCECSTSRSSSSSVAGSKACPKEGLWNKRGLHSQQKQSRVSKHFQMKDYHRASVCAGLGGIAMHRGAFSHCVWLLLVSWWLWGARARISFLWDVGNGADSFAECLETDIWSCLLHWEQTEIVTTLRGNF